MKIRDLQPADLPFIEQIHRESGFDYVLPDFFDEHGALRPQYPRMVVLEDESGEIVMAVAAKKLVEMYLWMNPRWRNPRWRLEAFTEVHDDMRRWLSEHGYSEMQCWVPPQIEKSFGKRLTRLFGWVAAPWKSFSRRTED